MTKLRWLIAGAVIAALATAAAFAQAPITRSVQLSQDPTGPFQVDSNNNLFLPRSQLSIGGFAFGAPFGLMKNLLDNGAMAINQRAATATCATTSGLATTSYAADRWGCDVNVGSGVGTMAVATGTPTPPAPFINELKLNRASGVFTQPLCAWQEINTSRVQQIQGQTVMISGFVAALAGLAADNGNAAQFVIITGTGSDQGMGVLRGAVGMTASPAITPAWTGIATLQTTTLALTTTYARFQGVPVIVPTTATELAVGICFTPTATGAGATDGIAFTGMQLEVLATGGLLTGGAGQPSSFEFRPQPVEQYFAQQKYFQITDSAANTVPVAMCQATTTAAVVCFHQLPVTMDVTPVVTASAATAFSDTATAGTPTACTAFSVVASSASPNAAKTTCTTGATVTAGGASMLTGAATSATLTFSADF